MARGFEKRTDPHGRDYFWLTGYFHNSEPNATDTDEWALNNGYVSVVPIHIDLTAYAEVERIKQWDFMTDETSVSKQNVEQSS